MNERIERFLSQERAVTGSGVILDRQISRLGKRERLASLYRSTLQCRDCPLAESRTRVVFGAGNAESDLVLIGEAPGRDEDLKGLPFVGPAGGFLDSVLADLDLNRKTDYFLTNIIKCRPPRNRDPLPDEISRCLSKLEKQLAILEPRFIITLGRIAAGILLGREESISRIRGRLFTYRGIPVVPVFHPAAILRDKNREVDFRGDLRFAVAEYRRVTSGFTWGPKTRKIKKVK